MARGLSKDEAVTWITQGFMDTKILGLPENLESSIKEMINKTRDDAM
jgi:Fe-S cluster assembly scaffold protein SufB